jgi:sugar phosphate isomerase/epimerase
MKLAVSNIAWAPSEARTAYALLRDHGFRGLEIAPALTFGDGPDPFAPSNEAVTKFCNVIADHGLELVSMQSLLFGALGAQLFGSVKEREAFEVAMERALTLAGRLGAPNLVFGSPANRSFPPQMTTDDTNALARETFRRLGDRACAVGAVVALEPNPVAYGTNFLTTVEAAADFVLGVDHPGITLNFDIGALIMNDEGGAVGRLADSARGHISHVHISEPKLVPAPRDTGQLAAIARALLAHGYSGWFSIEMRRVETDPLGELQASLRRATAAFHGIESKLDA